MSVVFPEPELAFSESELTMPHRPRKQRVPRKPVTMVMGIGGIACIICARKIRSYQLQE